MMRLTAALAALGVGLSLGACADRIGEGDVIEPAAGPAGTTRMDENEPVDPTAGAAGAGVGALGTGAEPIEPAAGPAGPVPMNSPDPILEADESAARPDISPPQGPDLGQPDPTETDDLPAVR